MRVLLAPFRWIGGLVVAVAMVVMLVAWLVALALGFVVGILWDGVASGFRRAEDVMVWFERQRKRG